MTRAAPTRAQIVSYALATVLLLTCAQPRWCFAHPAQMVAATATVKANGELRITARFDVLAFALNDTPARIDDASMNELLDGPPEELRASLDAARQRLLHGLVVECDTGSIATIDAVSTRFPTAQDVIRCRDSQYSPRLPLILDFGVTGRVADGARSVAVRFPEIMGTVVLTVERSGEEPYSEPVEPGRFSTPLPIRLTRAVVAGPQATAPNRFGASLKYLTLGFEHILPRGPDHVLFVLGLFLLSTRARPLLWQITAFTVAHSITLALSLYGVVRLPPIVVEPLIAMSIAFVAVENLFTSELKPWRPFVVFGFGLVHGLGFAGALTDMGLPRNQFVTALVTFNVGVELGQLAVIALAFAAVGWLRRCPWYRRGIVFPASTAIATIAVVWTVQRICM